MTAVDIDDFAREKQCFFEGERYSVRDNGAVLRHQREAKRVRVNDNQWTFGKESSVNPYLYISSVRVHRIVATAFHGEPPDSTYVVDHIDSNCRNNRPENLRWLTRLENALNNPVTRKKIENLCGSIEAFLENPSMLNNLRGDPNFQWMRTVTREEANNCKARMGFWASSGTKKMKSDYTIKRRNTFGSRAFKPLQKWEVGLDGKPGLDLALTPWCAQYMWRAPAYFPCCPQELGDDPINDYFQNLKSGEVFSYSDDEEFCPKHTIIKSVIIKNKESIVVMCARADGKWSVIGIDQSKRHFIHYPLGTFANKSDAEKAFSEKNELTDFGAEAYSHMRDGN